MNPVTRIGPSFHLSSVFPSCGTRGSIVTGNLVTEGSHVALHPSPAIKKKAFQPVRIVTLTVALEAQEDRGCTSYPSVLVRPHWQARIFHMTRALNQ